MTIPYLKGKRILITAGPTQEAIDPVRFLSNHSSGKQGVALAKTCQQHGADVTLVIGPHACDIPDGIHVIPIISADDMLEACLKSLPVDIVICAAAVSDWKPAFYVPKKQKKQPLQTSRQLELVQTVDILQHLATLPTPKRPHLVIGFAAETESVLSHAEEKLHRKSCDWILANDVSKVGLGFGSDYNHIIFVTKDGYEDWSVLSKDRISEELVIRIAAHLKT